MTTTYASLLLRLFSIWLLLLACRLRAQQVVPETSTEIVADSLASTTPPAETADSAFVTCDFDLENIESLLPFLPDICSEIYYNRTENESFNLYLEEAQNFAKFYRKLNDYELRGQPHGGQEELTKYPFEAKLRYESYNKVDVSQCLMLTSASASEYLKCLKEKRLELAELIPSVAEEK